MSACRYAAVILLSLSGAAEGHWRTAYRGVPAGLRFWFEHQRNARGQWCCDKSDGHPFYGAYTINPNGSVTVQLPTGPRTLPAYMVLDGPNPTGHAVYWYRDYGTVRLDYCFAPGTLS